LAVARNIEIIEKIVKNLSIKKSSKKPILATMHQ